jgi:hypothetical protein
MQGERRLVGNLLREVLTDARVSSIVAAAIAGSVAGRAALARGKRLGACGSFKSVMFVYLHGSHNRRTHQKLRLCQRRSAGNVVRRNGLTISILNLVGP